MRGRNCLFFSAVFAREGVMALIRKLAYLLLLSLTVLPLAAQAQATNPEPEAAIHDELRAVKQRLVDAVNKKDADALFAEMSPDIRFTAMNNDHVHGIKDGQAYFERMLKGADKFLNDLSMTSDVDDPATLYADNRVAVATGVSNTHFDIRGGLAFDVPLRWTATLERSSGKWKLAAIHFSADVASNPFLSAATVFWKWVAVGAAVIFLVVGFLIGRIRRKKA
jgi:ketosteroid isomerase-like protein